jgi:hypothetical protein
VHCLSNPRVLLRSSRRGLRRGAFGLSISPWLRRRSSSPVRNLHCCAYGFFVSSFLCFPIRAGPPSLSPHLPRRWCLSRLRFPTRGAPITPPRRRWRWPAVPTALPRPRAPPRRRWPHLVWPCPRPASLTDLSCAAPSSSPSLSSMDGRKKMR